MSDMTKKLNDGDHPSHLALIDYVIQIQLSKIEEYDQLNKTEGYHKWICELSENTMSNLIDLLELRLNVKKI